MCQHVRRVVEASGRAGQTLVEHFNKVLCGLLVGAVHEEFFVNPRHILLALELGQVARNRQGTQRHEHAGVGSQDVVNLAAQMCKGLKLALHPHDTLHAVREHKRRALAFHAILGLEISQDVAEIDVEEMRSVGDHEVVVVSIAEAEDIRGHAVRCQRN